MQRAADSTPPWQRAFCSFSEDTEVVLADGTTKPISEIEVGDEVWAADPETGREGPRPTLAVWIHQDTIIDLVVDGGTVSTTADHPFWNHTNQQWQAAEALQIGEQLLAADGTTTITIVGLDHTTARTDTAYNLSIADIHTYYVLAGNTPVLVHNTCVNWSPKSRPTFGHTFSQHGAGATNTKSLMDRARSTGQAQGQWLDNDAASDFLKGAHLPDAGPRGVVLPEGLGQVIMPDGSIVPATRAILVPSSNGLYKTAYPVLGP